MVATFFYALANIILSILANRKSRTLIFPCRCGNGWELLFLSDFYFVSRLKPTNYEMV